MPSLGLSLLKGALAAYGTTCKVLYANLHTLAAVPTADVLTLGESPTASLLYSALLRDDRDHDSVLDDVLSHTSQPTVAKTLHSALWKSKSGLRRLLRALHNELQTLADDIHAANWDVVGFTLVFEQTITSLALAKRLKNRAPELVTVLGGTSCDGEMGPGILSAFPFVDYTISGEADVSIIRFLQALTGETAHHSVPGLSYRSGDCVVQKEYHPVQALDALPLPDYTDYFDQAATSRFSYVLSKPLVPFELSRGCWWGQKHLCSFCGLNGTGLQFRRKSPARALNEITDISQRYRVQEFHAADNILDLDYFNEVLPVLARRRAEGEAAYTFFFETKSNLTRERIKTLADAGVRYLQPGIESFSDHILELMDKGATGIQQVQLLKWCEEYRITALWNIITHNPGERSADYDEMAALIPFIRHLPPPSGVDRMQLQRFSPYFLRPDRYGITNVRPSAIVARTYGLDVGPLSRLAYEFDFDCPPLFDEPLSRARDGVLAAIRDWRIEFRPDTLTYSPGPGFIRIVDQRQMTGRAKIAVLSGRKAELFSYCDASHSFSAICRRFAESPSSSLRRDLDSLIERRFMWRDTRDRHVSLPVRRDAQ